MKRHVFEKSALRPLHGKERFIVYHILLTRKRVAESLLAEGMKYYVRYTTSPSQPSYR